MTQTTVLFRKAKYPFYRTNRGIFDTSAAGYTPEMMAQGRQDAMLAFIYFQLKDCAKRALKPFDATFEQFIDETDETIFEVFSRLEQAKKEAEQKAAKQQLPGETKEG